MFTGIESYEICSKCGYFLNAPRMPLLIFHLELKTAQIGGQRSNFKQSAQHRIDGVRRRYNIPLSSLTMGIRSGINSVVFHRFAAFCYVRILETWIGNISIDRSASASTIFLL
jgi:hypothetical protein